MTPSVRPVIVQASDSVSTPGPTRDSTSEVPDTSTGAMVSPARNPQPMSTGSEPTLHSSCAASPKATAVPTKRAASVPGSRASP